MVKSMNLKNRNDLKHLHLPSLQNVNKSSELTALASAIWRDKVAHGPHNRAVSFKDHEKQRPGRWRNEHFDLAMEMDVDEVKFQERY